MISALFFFNFKGDVLISRVYRAQDVGKSASDAFRVHIIHSRHQVRSPVMTIGHTSFFHINVEGLWLCAVTRQNVNAAMVFEFLRKLVNIFKVYFGKLSEDAIRRNFVLLYELLDEVLDYGYPQRTEADLLRLYITQQGESVPRAAEAHSITMHATGANTWRRPGIKYRKNEVFIDVVETINMLMTSQGHELQADVTGQVIMRCYLSGMPECRFGLNDMLSLDHRDRSRGVRTTSKDGFQIEDVQFHQSVRQGAMVDNGVSFTPPDGEFELMKYRTAVGVRAPFRVIPVVRDVGKTRMEAMIVVKSLFSAKMMANVVEVRFPTPNNAANVRVTVTAGKAKYKAGENAIVWRMRKFAGETEAQLSAEIGLISTTEKRERHVSRAPVKMAFNVPMFTASGMQVRFLKVMEPKLGYDTIKWVRYMTKAGSFEARIGN